MQEFFETLGIEHWLAIGSAVLALASFILNMRLVNRQEKRDAIAMKLAHDSDIIRWADEVIALLAAAQEMVAEKGVSFGEAEFPSRRSSVRAHLSALIDRGRLFFPNREDGDYGKEKEAGFQGRRHPALDALVDAYAQLDRSGSSPGPDREAIAAITVLRRKFMAEVFQAVDPVRRGEKVKELTS
jgi:hypothetical protein